MSDNPVNISHKIMRCQQVAHGVHVAAEIFLPESLVVGRRIGIQINYIAVLQLSCDIIYYPDKAFLAAILPGHGDKEKFCIRLDGLQPLDDFCIPAGEGRSEERRVGKECTG